MTALICVLVLAAVVIVALWLWRDNPVIVHLQLLGARVHLETKGPKGKNRHLRSAARAGEPLGSAIGKPKPGEKSDEA